MNTKDIEKTKIRQCINQLIAEINEDPAIFRTETDVQARLYKYICDELDEWKPKHEIKARYRSKQGFYRVNRVHCEFFGGGKQRIDMGIFDKEDLFKIEKFSMEKRTVPKDILLAHAIEIKTERGESGQGLRDNPINDLKKLLNYKKKKPHRARNVYFIYIVRWPTNVEDKQTEVMNLVKELKNFSSEIDFFTNDPKNYFLPYLNKAIKSINER